MNINSALSLNSLCSSIYSPNSTAATADVWATSDTTVWTASASSVYTYSTTIKAPGGVSNSSKVVVDQ